MKKVFLILLPTLVLLLSGISYAKPLKACIPAPELHNALYHNRIAVAVKDSTSSAPTDEWFTVVDDPRTANDPLIIAELTKNWQLSTVERNSTQTWCEYLSTENNKNHYFSITWIPGNN